MNTCDDRCQGWFRFPRELLCRTSPNERLVILEIFSRAAFKNRTVQFGGKTVDLEPGQCLLSVRSMATDLGLSHKAIRHAISGLVRGHAIEATGAHGGTMFSVVDWAQSEQAGAHDPADRGTAMGNPSKNEEEWKKEQRRESETLTNGVSYPLPQEHGTQSPSNRVRNAAPRRSGRALAETDFEDWWGRWLPGTKHEKREAGRIYRRLLDRDEVSHADLCEGLDRYMRCCRQERTELRYIKHPTTWLNQGCWDDDAQPGGTPLRPNGKDLPFACGL